jgi:DNA-binding transcriptional LysR family regulator
MDEKLDALVPRLRQFAAVARTEHLTRAADQLGVPQPTLSRTIAHIEEDLGVPLFTRPGRSIKLTRHGRLLSDTAERALALLQATLDQLTGEADPEHGRIALAFLPTLGTDVVPRLLRDFRSGHPEIRFALVQDNSSVMLEKLLAGEVDMCLTVPVPTAQGVEAASLEEQRVDLFVPSGHRLARRRTIRLAEAAAEDFICTTPGHGLRIITDELCNAAGFTPRIVFEGEQVATIRGLVGAGLGVALLPADPEPDPGVARIRITQPKAARMVCLTWMADRELTAPAAAFREFVLGYRGKLIHAEEDGDGSSSHRRRPGPGSDTCLSGLDTNSRENVAT